ncbi:hypothetical protein ACFSM9_29410, partial [Microvirga arabica]|uniref:hypothetical protein n=1 Tax=Microvirga arabica TaxID=1128671 RepID=UPI00363F7624
AAGIQNHRGGVAFSNNLSKSGVGDRNLYVDEVTFNGRVQSQDVAITNSIDKNWFFTLLKG